MNVTVVGCGYVGVVTAAGLASIGHEVVGVELDSDRRRALEAGRAPFHEPGLDELLRGELDRGRLALAADSASAATADVVFLAVQTPSADDGSIDLRFLRAAVDELAGIFARSQRPRVVAVRSTVVPGTTESVVRPLLDPRNTSVAANPEFLREGSAVSDFLEPDRIVIGCEEDRGRALLEDAYRPVGAPIIFTTPTTAELAKYASNAFLATLISFSNEFARIAEALPGVDVEDVLGILHRDRRLSPALNGEQIRPPILDYLKAGSGYGGSCLPKDLSALLASRAQREEHHPLLEAVQLVNRTQPGRVVALAERALGGVDGRRVAVLGLAFKGGTDDLRDSPGLKIIDELQRRGAQVVAFDPLVDREQVKRAGKDIDVVTTLDEALLGVDACVVTTNAQEFRELGARLGPGPRRPVVVDGRRIIDPRSVDDYQGIGLGADIRPH